MEQKGKNHNVPKRHHVIEGVGANAGPGKDSFSKINGCILTLKKTPKLLQSVPTKSQIYYKSLVQVGKLTLQ